MLYPTGLHRFAKAFPDRCFDVGIAEQHAVTSAAGLAMGGLHPVVAVYATFLNRAFDQLLMDVALHRCGVTFVLDRAGVTGPDGASHHGMWDMSITPAGARPAPGRPSGRHPAAGGAGPVADTSTTRRRCCDSPRTRCRPTCPRSSRSTVWTCCCATERAPGARGRLRAAGGHRRGGGRAAGRPGDRGHRGRPGLGAAGQPGAGPARRASTSWWSPSRTTAWSAAAAPGWPRRCGSPRCVRRCASSASRRQFLDHGSRAELLAEVGLTPRRSPATPSRRSPGPTAAGAGQRGRVRR